jgi:hypothetical protein
MVNTNFTSQTITQQLAQRSGQVAIAAKNGGLQFVDQLTNKPLSGPSADSSLLANPQKPNDPKLSAAALDAARGYFSGKNIPAEFIEAVASVAAYVSAVNNIPVESLINNRSVSLKLIQAYNEFKPKGSQVGVLLPELKPSWFQNPTLRGSVAAAITDQP